MRREEVMIPMERMTNMRVMTQTSQAPEVPEWVGTGKFYKPQALNRKAMVNMFKKFCDLNDRDANAIVVYFGIYSKGCLAEFLHEHWKDTFIKWQRQHPKRDSPEWAMVLSPPSRTAYIVLHGHATTGATSHDQSVSSASRT